MDIAPSQGIRAMMPSLPVTFTAPTRHAPRMTLAPSRHSQSTSSPLLVTAVSHHRHVLPQNRPIRIQNLLNPAPPTPERARPRHVKTQTRPPPRPKMALTSSFPHREAAPTSSPSQPMVALTSSTRHEATPIPTPTPTPPPSQPVAVPVYKDPPQYFVAAAQAADQAATLPLRPLKGYDNRMKDFRIMVTRKIDGATAIVKFGALLPISAPQGPVDILGMVSLRAAVQEQLGGDAGRKIIIFRATRTTKIIGHTFELNQLLREVFGAGYEEIQLWLGQASV